MYKHRWMSQDVKKMCLSRYYRAVLTIKFRFCFYFSQYRKPVGLSKLCCEVITACLPKDRLKMYLLFFAKSYWPGSPSLIKSRTVWWLIHFSKIAAFPFPLSFFFLSFFSTGCGGGRGHTALETCRTYSVYLSWCRVCIFGSLVFWFNWERPVLFWFYIQ